MLLEVRQIINHGGRDGHNTIASNARGHIPTELSVANYSICCNCPTSRNCNNRCYGFTRVKVSTSSPFELEHSKQNTCAETGKQAAGAARSMHPPMAREGHCWHGFMQDRLCEGRAAGCIASRDGHDIRGSRDRKMRYVHYLPHPFRHRIRCQCYQLLSWCSVQCSRNIESHPMHASPGKQQPITPFSCFYIWNVDCFSSDANQFV